MQTQCSVVPLAKTLVRFLNWNNTRSLPYSEKNHICLFHTKSALTQCTSPFVDYVCVLHDRNTCTSKFSQIEMLSHYTKICIPNPKYMIPSHAFFCLIRYYVFSTRRNFIFLKIVTSYKRMLHIKKLTKINTMRNTVNSSDRLWSTSEKRACYLLLFQSHRMLQWFSRYFYTLH